MSTAYALFSEAGGREANEDCVAVETTSDGLMAVVCDGLGAHGGGAQASRAACGQMAECFHQGLCGDKEGLCSSIAQAHGAVVACQTSDCAMKTTLAALVIAWDGRQEAGQLASEEAAGDGDYAGCNPGGLQAAIPPAHPRRVRALWAHVGDTRLYHFWNGKLVGQTLDHSVSQLAVDMGLITGDQIRFHEDRSRLLRALGSDSPEPEPGGPVLLAKGFHAFLLGTDGFWEYVTEPEMEETLAVSSDPRQWLSRMKLILQRKGPGDRDNASAAAIFITEEALGCR